MSEIDKKGAYVVRKRQMCVDRMPALIANSCLLSESNTNENQCPSVIKGFIQVGKRKLSKLKAWWLPIVHHIIILIAIVKGWWIW